MDATDASLDRAQTQWDVYHRAIAATKIPVKAVLGNHDIFGWGVKEMSDTTAGYGQAMALDQLELAKPYYSFDAGGWHFVMLDSMTRRDFSYTGTSAPSRPSGSRPTSPPTPASTSIVFSHIPILSVCVFFDGGAERIGTTDWNVPDAWMHRDAHAIVDILDEHNVKLAVSGHIHLVDRCDYRNVTFICDGAVSGNWWKGPLAAVPRRLWRDRPVPGRAVRAPVRDVRMEGRAGGEIANPRRRRRGV